MDDPVIQGVRAILEIGWPAITLIQTIVLWRAYKDKCNEFTAFLIERHPESTQSSSSVALDEQTPA